MTADRIAAQDARVRAVGSQFWNGNNALDTLDVTLGGNSMGQIPGAVYPYTGYAVGPPASQQGAAAGESKGRFSAARRSDCPAPTVLPLMTVFPIPPAPAPASQHPPATAPPTPHAPTPAPAPPPPVAPVDCRTGNICNDIRRGCVLQSQVSPEQLFACSQAGYVGNLNLFPAQTLRTDLPFLGSPDLNPPAFNAAGVSGLGDGAMESGAFWGGLALMAFAVYAVIDMQKPRRRR